LFPQKAGAPARVIIERINDCRTIGSPGQATILDGDHVACRNLASFADV
jgi:hypothetical protein